MSKSRPRVDNQLSILDFLRGLSEQSQKPTTEGQFRCVDRLRAAMRRAIRDCPLPSRYEIAGQMSHLLGQTITKEQIDSWTREDQTNGELGTGNSERIIRRHIPAEYLPAFCKVTGSTEPIRIAGELLDLFVFKGPEAIRVDIQRTDEEIRRLQGEKRKMTVFLKEMERPK